ncbi:MAG TPA: glycoside hydrolase family 88 protein [Actinoplanes sp.]|jgi:unsaturated rhamnogalacturonyl hydrolase
MANSADVTDRRTDVLTALLSMQRQSWEQGVAAHAAIDLGHTDLAVLLAHAAVTRQGADGRLGDLEMDDNAVNSGACGEAVLLAHRITGDARYAEAAGRQLEWFTDHAPRAADGTLFHMMDGHPNQHEAWADTVYMAAPFLAVAGRTDLAELQVQGHRRRLWDETSGLYSAIWREDDADFGRAAHWGTGSGWVVAAIARCLHLVADWPDGTREKLAGHAREVVDACLTHRRPDGLFHDVLDDPTTFRETNIAQMLAYTTLTGVADGWLPESYADTGRDLIEAATRQVDDRGLVTEACGSPRFDHSGTSSEAQAFHLLALAARDRLDPR